MDQKITLSGVFCESFTKDGHDEVGQPTKEVINYVKIYLMDHNARKPFEVKPLNTEDFITNIYPRIEDSLGKEVDLVLKTKLVDGKIEPRVVDILIKNPNKK